VLPRLHVAGCDLSRIPSELPREHPYHVEAALLRNKLLRWRYDNYFAPIRKVKRLSVEGRLFQLYEPVASVTDDLAALVQLENCIYALNDEMTEDRGNSTEAHVATALQAYAPRLEMRVPLASLASRVFLTSGTSVTSKEVGPICRSFGLATKRQGAGMFVLIQPAKMERILSRCGLSSPGTQEEDDENAESVGNVAS